MKVKVLKEARHYIKDKKVWSPLVERAVSDAAKEFGINPEFLRRVIWVESRGNDKAISSAGAKGILQFMPGTWKRITKRLSWTEHPSGTPLPDDDVFDPVKNIRASASYFKLLQDRLQQAGFKADTYDKETWPTVFGSYNAGYQNFVHGKKKSDGSHYTPFHKRAKYMAGRKAAFENAISSVVPATRVLYIGDSNTGGMKSSLEKLADKAGWDAKVMYKNGAGAAWWHEVMFKKPRASRSEAEINEIMNMNREITEYAPTYKIVGTLGGNDYKWYVGGDWDAYLNNYVKPLMAEVDQWGGSMPSGKEYRAKDGGKYDAIKEIINNDYKLLASNANVPYIDVREYPELKSGIDPESSKPAFSSYKPAAKRRFTDSLAVIGYKGPSSPEPMKDMYHDLWMDTGTPGVPVPPSTVPASPMPIRGNLGTATGTGAATGTGTSSTPPPSGASTPSGQTSTGEPKGYPTNELIKQLQDLRRELQKVDEAIFS